MSAVQGNGASDDPAQQKTEQHDNWQKASTSYSKWVIEAHMLQGLYDTIAATLTHKLGDAGAVQVLDVASASGEPAVSVARALPHSMVVSTDLAEEYQHLGRERAKAAGLQQRVSFQTADAEDLQQFQSQSFDAVTCSLGLMFMPQYPSALREFHRVLKQGGVAVISVWQSVERWPFLKALMTFCKELDPAMVGGSPLTPTRFGDDPSELLLSMEASGLREVSRRDLEVTFHIPPGLWWEAMVEMPLPLQKILAAKKAQGDDGAVEAAHAALEARFLELGFLREDGSLHVEGNFCHLITAVK